MTRPVVLVAGGLCLVALVAGLRLGLGQAGLSETDVINRVADRYVAETGGARTDCLAVPSAVSSVWLEVRCGSGEGLAVYPVDHRGRVVEPSVGPEA
ncbi:MAG: hypothetical protein AAFY80_09610 [Pseudomonadota bacterium]